MANDIEIALRKVAQSHSDPVIRAQAERRLARRGAPVMGPESDQSDRATLDATKREIARRRQEVDDHSLLDMSEAPEIAAGLANRMANSATFGAYNAALDPLSELTGVPVVPPRSSRDKLNNSMVGQFAGATADAMGAAIGAPAALGNAVASRTLKQLAPEGAGLARRVLSGGASGALSGGAVSAAQAGVKGEGLESAAADTFLGMGVGSAFGAGAEAMPTIKKGIQGAIRKDEKLGALRRAEETGMYRDDPDLKVRNERQLNRVAIDNQKRVADGLDSRRSELSRDYGAAEEATLATHPKVKAEEVLQALEARRLENTGTQGQSFEPIDDALAEIYAKLAPDENGMISTKDLLKARKSFQGRSGNLKLAPTAEERPWRLLQKEIGETLPPGLREANKKYHEELLKMERVNDVLQSSDDATMSSRAAKERSAARNIRRVGDESEAGDIMQSQLREIADLDPSVAAALDRQQAADAYKSTRGKIIPKGVRLRDWLGLAGQNLRAGGRLVDSAAGIAEPAAAAAGMATRTMPLGADIMGEDMEAALQERKRRRNERK